MKHSVLVLRPLTVANCYTASIMEIVLQDDALLFNQVIRADYDYLQSLESDEDTDAYDTIKQAIIKILTTEYPPVQSHPVSSPNYLPFCYYSEIETENGIVGCDISLSGSDTNYVITITAQFL